MQFQATKMLNGWAFSLHFITVLVFLCNPRGVSHFKPVAISSSDDPSLSRQDLWSSLSVLQYDFYRESCPHAEKIVRSTMALIYSRHKDVSASLLRLLFHDCFIHGCDASILLDDGAANKSYSSEKQAIPNLTFKVFDEINVIKEELEKVCPRVVSCADILSLATRDGIVLAGGPFYPILTGRRDSTKSYYEEAMADIPRPNDNISRTLQLFKARGFDEIDTVSLLGAHNIVKVYGSDDGTTFRSDFAKAMVKLSTLNVLAGSQCEIRGRCSS